MDRRWHTRKPKGVGRIVLVLTTLATGLVLFAPSQASAFPPAVTVTSDPGALVSGPGGITAGPDGNLWFTNGDQYSIGRITPDGVITSYIAAAFDPSGLWGLGGITTGPDGALWFTVGALNGGSIDRMTTSGVVVSHFTGPSIDEPGSIVTGSDGALWFTQLNNTIGRITTSGAVTTYTDPTFDTPSDITAGPDGALWFMNVGDRTIGRITTSGVVSNFTVSGQAWPSALAAGPDGEVWFLYGKDLGEISSTGSISMFKVKGDYGSALTEGPDGALWFSAGKGTIGRFDTTTDTASHFECSYCTPFGVSSVANGSDGAMWFVNHYNSSIVRMTTSGVVSNFTAGGFDNPHGITFGPDGSFWVTNTAGNSVGRLSYVTINGNPTGLADVSDSSINQPEGITSGPDGALWFTNAGNNSIGRITTTGSVTNYTDPSIDQPENITAGPDGALWFTNAGNNSIGRITTTGSVTNYTDPSIDQPENITAGPDGALWFTNAGNNSIGRITTTGSVTNYTDPSIDQPEGITVGPDGAPWFTNAGNNSIGRISTSGVVSNYTDPSIDQPEGITVGPDGALWFTNAGNNSIGRITTTGSVTNYTDPSIDQPNSITTGPNGDLWFTNTGSNTVGQINTPAEILGYGSLSGNAGSFGIYTAGTGRYGHGAFSFYQSGWPTPSTPLTLREATVSCVNFDDGVATITGQVYLATASENVVAQVGAGNELALSYAPDIYSVSSGCWAPTGSPQLTPRASGAIDIELGDTPSVSADQILGADEWNHLLGMETQGTGNMAQGALFFYQKDWPSSDSPWTAQTAVVTCVSIDGTAATVTGKVTDGSKKETVVAVLRSSPPALTIAAGRSVSRASPGCDVTQKAAKPLKHGGDIEIGS